MNTLIKHLWDNNREEIINKSLMNCHVKGLHSIILLESPGKTIRLYITDKDHELYTKKALSFHPHHCNLTLECIEGLFSNWIIRKDDVVGATSIPRFIYKSAILEEEGGFIMDGVDKFVIYHPKFVYKGESVFMKSTDIHSVSIPEGMISAWLVYEGIEDSSYKSYAWSKKDLRNETFEGLYVKPNANDIYQLLKSIKAI